MSETDPERGEVWRVDFDPWRGSEPNKRRPAVVLSVSDLSRLRTRIVVPLTTWQRHHGNQWNKVLVQRDDANNLDLDSAADVALIRALDLTRFEERVGILTVPAVREIAERVTLAVGYLPDF
ncbi:MAG: type II toxin-antitoxin system PemK/MazF family toxin [Dehalococcoidia bacterium]